MRLRHQKFCAIAGVFALMLYSPARAEEQNLTIGPGLVSFPELASDLSVTGRHVECPASLRDCAAFVSLKNRTWQKAADLLSTGLDIELVADGKDRWVIQRDRAVREREKRWFGRLTANLETDVRAHLARYRPFLEKSLKEMLVRAEALKAELDELRKSDPDLRSARAREIDTEWHTLVVGADSREAVTAALFQTGWLSPTMVREAINGRYAVKTGSAASLPRQCFDAAPFEVSDLAISAVQFDPALMSLTLSVQIATADGRTIPISGLQTEPHLRGSLIDVFLPGEAEGVAWSGLGKDAVEWLARERLSSRAFLDSAIAKEPFGLPKDRRLTSVSQIVEAWSLTTRTEAIMELWPQREALVTLHEGTKTSLADVFNEVIAAGDPNHTDRAHAWSLRSDDGVLFVKNRMAFVDRQQIFPLAAFLPLERRTQFGLYRETQPVNGAPFDALTQYSRSVPPVQNARWDTIQPAREYRGIDLQHFAAMQPAMVLWEALSPEEKRDWITRVKPRDLRTFDIPMSRFDRATLERFLSVLRAYGLRNTRFWHPDCMRYLSRCTLSVKLWPSYPDMSRADVLMGLVGQDGKRILAELRVFGVPLPQADAALHEGSHGSRL